MWIDPVYERIKTELSMYNLIIYGYQHFRLLFVLFSQNTIPS